MAEEIQFEKALQKLEKIVADLESGEISLEEALKKYEEGIKLARACQNKLNEAEKKIEILSRDLNGQLSKAPFQYEEEVEISTAKKRSAAKKSSLPQTGEEGSNEDLLL